MPRRRKDSDILRLQQRSNGLAFSHHHFLLGGSPRPLHSSILFQIDGSSPSQPREKTAKPLLPVEENAKQEITVFRQSIRSLIPPVVPVRLKTEPNTIRRRRNSSSSASVKSYTSSMISRFRKTTGLTPTLANLPVEILDNIVQFLPQSALYALLLTNSNFIETTASYLYLAPQFASTYRYAQFAYQVSHKPYYADMVRELDLSYFGKIGLDKEGELEPMAGWREFKYSHQRMSKNGGVTTHPSPSPFLKSFHRTRDLPIGGLCHVLAACKRIRKINLSRTHLASDFLLSPSPFPSTPSPTTSPSIIPAPSTSGLLFVSDVPKSFNLATSSPSLDLVPIYADFVISHLLELPRLQNLKLKKCLWLTTTRVDRLMQEAGEALVEVDFRDSGMQQGVNWTIKGSRKEVERKVGEGLGRFNRELYGVDPPPGLSGVLV